MEDLNSLKILWSSPIKVELPDYNILIDIAKRYKYRIAQKKLIAIFFSILLFGIIVFSTFRVHSLVWTTRVGEFLLGLFSLYYFISNILSIKRFLNFSDLNNVEFLAFLEKTQKNQLFFKEYTQSILLIFLSTGILMFEFEFIYQCGHLLEIFYISWGVFISIIWFWVRPKVFRKEAQKILEIINKIKDFKKET